MRHSGPSRLGRGDRGAVVGELLTDERSHPLLDPGRRHGNLDGGEYLDWQSANPS